MAEDFNSTIADDPAQPLASMPAAPVATLTPDEKLDKIIIAIHGIGRQQRSSTIRSVAMRFGDHKPPPLPLMPLGFFHVGVADKVHVSRLEVSDDHRLRRIGFAEVFWADIPGEVVKANDTLEEAKAWGASVVSRAHAMYQKELKAKIEAKTAELGTNDFRLAAGVVDEIIETIAVLENLLTVVGKMGVFKFDLAPLLRDYIGDVQIVTEFKHYQQKIVSRLHDAIDQISKRYIETSSGKPLEIYIVAHSEGTVVAFLGLLKALSGHSIFDPAKNAEDIPPTWIGYVRGFMTIGSPIDKHLLLWPKMWQGMKLESSRDAAEVVFKDEQSQVRLRLPQPIKWRNYYDFADPIGFELDTARKFLKKDENKCVAFDFEKRHDRGFSRYWLPGKAHNDYWGDAEVFGHFIDDVVMPPEAGSAPSSAPASSWLRGVISTAIPYLVAFALHLAGVFLLFKAVTDYLIADSKVGGPPPAILGQEVFLLGTLLFGITVAARLPRLVKTVGLRWHGIALVAFLFAAWLNWKYLPIDLANFLAQPMLARSLRVLGELGEIDLVNFLAQPMLGLNWGSIPESVTQFLTSLMARLNEIGEAVRRRPGVLALLLVAGLIALSGWWMPRRPRWARRSLIGIGALAVVLMLVGHMTDTHSTKPIWPVILAGMAFLYLWWLGILVFDLAFIWHRYIRFSVAVKTLRAWSDKEDAWPDVSLRKKPENRAAAT